MAHQLGAYTDCNHGQGLAVIRPVLYRYMLLETKDKFARVAVQVWDLTPASSQGTVVRMNDESRDYL